MRRQSTTRTTRAFVALLFASAVGFSPAHGASDEEPDPRPMVLGCYGGEIGVGNGGTTRACRSEQGALWFFVVPQADRRLALEVAYRFDAVTRELSPVPIDTATVPSRVREAWEAFRDESSPVVQPRSSRWSVHSKASLHLGRRRFEIEERAILVQEGLDFRLHAVPQPSWADVDGWAGALRSGVPAPGAEPYLRAAHEERPPVSRLGPYALSNGRLFFGLQGGFTEGEGGFGGLAIFDLDAESWDVLRPVQLREAAVTDVVPDPNRGTLWIGTVHYGEYGPYPASGLLRFDLQDCTWTGFTTENSGLAGDMVWWLRWTSDGLWVSTENGLSRLDLEDGSFRSFRWSPAAAGSPIAFELKADSPSRKRSQLPERSIRGRVVAGVAPQGAAATAERRRRAARSCWKSESPATPRSESAPPP
jgi:hypothetical protein